MKLKISKKIDENLRADIDTVFFKIKEKFPEDAIRLCKRISIIRPLPLSESEKGTCGRWKAIESEKDSHSSPLEIATHKSLGITRAALRGVIAHEFGHCVSRIHEIYERLLITETWAQEWTADWYACKWGFRRNIKLLLKNRELNHHSIFPGEHIIIGEGNDEMIYTLDDNFRPVLVKGPNLSLDRGEDFDEDPEGFV